MERLLLIGLDEPEYLDLKPRVEMPIVFHPDLPLLKMEKGTLLVESHTRGGRMLPVSRVIFHGIFEDDFDVITALALWRGPCLPSARGLLDCRLRLPCLARALSVTRFGALPRGFAHQGIPLKADTETVAKWGNWHCGENKQKFTDLYTSQEPTLFEPFIKGEAVRIMIIGQKFWQIRLMGDSWLKSIHHQDAALMPVDEELLEDTRRLGEALSLEMLGVDYMISEEGQKYLLEVNHIPNVTRFPELRSAFLDFASEWANRPLP